MSHRPSGQAPSRLVAVLGPTNTGKTHLAVERMLGHASGMIGLPLRLLAREIYDRIVKARGARSVALITGEEKIIPPHAHYFVCTVEAMPLTRQVEFLAVDEIQLAADPERGHVFTQRLLHARGMSTVAWGAEAVGVFLFAMAVKERTFRLSALLLLLVCVAKVVLIDVWGLPPLERDFTIIIVSVALVAVSIVFTRYKEVLRAYL